MGALGLCHGALYKGWRGHAGRLWLWCVKAVRDVKVSGASVGEMRGCVGAAWVAGLGGSATLLFTSCRAGKILL